MLGVENIKKLIFFSLALNKETAKALEDKKFKLKEILGFIDEFLLIPGLVNSWEAIKAEFNDGITDAEKLELHSYFVAEFDIPNDEVEQWIEDALLHAVLTVKLIERFKNLKK